MSVSTEITEAASAQLNQPALPENTSKLNVFQRLGRFILAPRSKNRDEAFRERTIRISITIITIFSVLSLAISQLVFRDPFEPLSPPTLWLIMLTLSIASAVAVSYQRLLYAGIFLVAIFLVGAIGLMVIKAMSPETRLYIPTFLICLVMAAMVLPRYTLVPLGVLGTILIGSLLEYAHPGEASNTSELYSSPFVFLVTSLLLRQLRVEFDNRFAAMRESISEAEAARREADTANRAKSQFLANMSHELRTPLNAIIGYTEIMLGGMVGAFTEKQTELQGHVQTNARRLLNLINDILDLAKIESGTLQVLLTPATPSKFVTDTIASMQSLAEKKGVYLKTIVDDSIPASVLTDVTKIQQVVTNLVGNALKFTSAGGVEVKLGAADPTTWYFKVTDTGRGMPADAVNYIFDIFRQVEESDSREQKGTGLGLAITKRLIDRLGGRISVETELGKGSTFTVTLPRHTQQ